MCLSLVVYLIFIAPIIPIIIFLACAVVGFVLRMKSGNQRGAVYEFLKDLLLRW